MNKLFIMQFSSEKSKDWIQNWHVENQKDRTKANKEEMPTISIQIRIYENIRVMLYKLAALATLHSQEGRLFGITECVHAAINSYIKTHGEFGYAQAIPEGLPKKWSSLEPKAFSIRISTTINDELRKIYARDKVGTVTSTPYILFLNFILLDFLLHHNFTFTDFDNNELTSAAEILKQDTPPSFTIDVATPVDFTKYLSKK